MKNFPITMDGYIHLLCLDCKEDFWIDGDTLIKDAKCPDCGSHNHTEK